MEKLCETQEESAGASVFIKIKNGENVNKFDNEPIQCQMMLVLQKSLMQYFRLLCFVIFESCQKIYFISYIL